MKYTRRGVVCQELEYRVSTEKWRCGAMSQKNPTLPGCRSERSTATNLEPEYPAACDNDRPGFSGRRDLGRFGFSVQVLITRFIGAQCHGGHPEVIGIGSKGIDGLIEGYYGLLEKGRWARCISFLTIPSAYHTNVTPDNRQTSQK